ncbi:MAG TPA: hypothetical protein VLH79_16525 [Chthonomonadales bacterium]|nr:hypothetical protein [Chthonomonadales bacterium]
MKRGSVVATAYRPATDRPAEARSVRRLSTRDLDLGLRLLADRSVPRRDKGVALLIGLALAAVTMAAVALIAARALVVPASALESIPAPLLVVQSLLVGAAIAGLLLIRRTPLPVVSRVRVERYRVTPLRRRGPAGPPHGCGR